MKRLQVCMLAVLSTIMIVGCKTTTEDEAKQEDCFPEKIYIEANRVTVDCELEIDDGSRNQQKQLSEVGGEIYTKAENANQTYVVGKEVKDEYHDEGRKCK